MIVSEMTLMEISILSMLLLSFYLIIISFNDWVKPQFQSGMLFDFQYTLLQISIRYGILSYKDSSPSPQDFVFFTFAQSGECEYVKTTIVPSLLHFQLRNL